MKTIHVNNFGGGIAPDPYSVALGEFSNCRNFDIHAFPHRLIPLPSMTADTTGTAVGNMIIAHDLKVYGMGCEVANPGQGQIWVSTGSGWTALTKSTGGGAVNYNMLVDYPSSDSGLSMIFAGVNKIVRCDPLDSASNVTQVLTFVAGSISQGYVHPTNNVLYFGYSTTSGTFIASYNGATNTWNLTALTLPKRYTVVSINKYGNYLAIGCTTYSTAVVPGGGTDNSVIFLWNMDETQSWNESVPLGDNSLFALNNLEGYLVSASTLQGNDYGSLQIQAYSGGQPQMLKEIMVDRTDPSTSPTFNSYRVVNFIHRNKMYFSLDLVGGGSSTSKKGLWAFGKNKSGQWAINVERYGTTDGSDASVLAAAFRLDYLFACVTSVGTLNVGVTSAAGWASEFASPSYLETSVNPLMDSRRDTKLDVGLQKQLASVALHYVPLPSTGQVVLKYRVDGGSWITIFTETTTGAVVTERTMDASSTQFTQGRNYEFRIESTGGARVLGLTYKYEDIPTAL